MWSKIKQILRGIKARNHEELFAGVGKALSLVSVNDAQGWFEIYSPRSWRGGKFRGFQGGEGT
jgi:hypothetical protein